jgi:hypothetical protein
MAWRQQQQQLLILVLRFLVYHFIFSAVFFNDISLVENQVCRDAPTFR